MVDVHSHAEYIRTCGRTNKTVLMQTRRVGDERTDFSQRVDAGAGSHGSGRWVGRTRYATKRRGSRTAARDGVPGQRGGCNATESTASCPTLVNGRIVQPQRELPVLHQTDVLVIGGGTAGVTAALAARRTGADVTLVERYGHLGGLWTGSWC